MKTPQEWWEDRSPAVKSRIVRLNPNLFVSPEMYQGVRLRGFHPAATAWRECMCFDVMGKREFVARYGRMAWKYLPESAKHRNGRRCYVARSDVLSKVWMISFTASRYKRKT